MKFFLLVSIVLLCAGCGGRTRINTGADLAVYIGSTQYMHSRITEGNLRAYSRLDGFYDPANGDIVLNEQLRGVGWVQVWSDELQHAYAHQRPADLIELLRRYESPDFKLIAHGKEEIAILNALCATYPPADPTAPSSRNPK
jgi:hypothetical protein